MNLTNLIKVSMLLGLILLGFNHKRPTINAIDVQVIASNFISSNMNENRIAPMNVLSIIEDISYLAHL